MQSHPEIFEALFRRNILSPDNKEFLQQATNKYPFFAPAQFYLLAQSKDETDTFELQAAKTAILFNNSFWLNYQLEQSFKTETLKSLPEVVAVATVEEQEPIQETAVEPIEAKDPEPAKFQPFYTIYTKEEVTPEPVIEPVRTEPVLFQPLYTTDYFASQGIKLSDEVLPTDKLGVQLKSFTEWLKTMKKVHPERMTQTDQHADEKIQTLAERSNHEQEIVTEAMAEVLIQQGLKQKALEVYEKLSLLSPAKSVYFAAKIEQLKEH
jgi:hypothetical protein